MKISALEARNPVSVRCLCGVEQGSDSIMAHSNPQRWPPASPVYIPPPILHAPQICHCQLGISLQGYILVCVIKFMSFIDEVPSDNLISMHTKSPEELWAEMVDRHNSNLVKEPIHYSFTSLRLYMTARIEPSSAVVSASQQVSVEFIKLMIYHYQSFNFK